VTLQLILTAVVALIFLSLPRIPQPEAYHLFAERRSLLGMPNLGDVASNVPFGVIGVWGLIFLLRSDSNEATECFLEPGERWPIPLRVCGAATDRLPQSPYRARRISACLTSHSLNTLSDLFSNGETLSALISSIHCLPYLNP
jgi:hypothetical protein